MSIVTFYCTQGITAVGNSLCIGTSEGSVLVFSMKEEGVEFQQQLDGHQAPVTCMASSIDGRMASGDETGGVLVWSDPVRSSEKLKLFDDERYMYVECTMNMI